MPPPPPRKRGGRGCGHRDASGDRVHRAGSVVGATRRHLAATDRTPWLQHRHPAPPPCRSTALPYAPIAELQGVTKTYFKPDGSVLVEALRPVDLRNRRRAVHGDHGRVGLGQEHADEHPRLPGPADVRLHTCWMGRTWRRSDDDALSRDPRPADRVHLPGVQPDQRADDRGERRGAAVLPGRAAGSSPAAGDRETEPGGSRRPAHASSQRAVRRPAAARRHRASRW